MSITPRGMSVTEAYRTYRNNGFVVNRQYQRKLVWTEEEKAKLIHTFEELGPAWTDRFISARRVRVSFLKRDEVLPLLTEPIPEFDMTYAPGVLDAIIVATNCQPFLTQAVAFELVQFLNEQQRKEVMPNDVEEAIARALVSGGEYFANVWSDAGENGQAILRALVMGETLPDFPTARVWLREHDVLNNVGKFAVPMVEQWVKERAW